jgi:TatD DNase family protein
MFIDIHRHGPSDEGNVIAVRNLFPDQIGQIYPNKLYSVGLHPWHVDHSKNKQIEEIRTVLDRPEVVAIGETGLDNKVTVDYILQIEAFEQQIEMAEQQKLPVIVHCVKAYNDLVSIRKRSKTERPWIIHWFNASLQIAQELIGLNCYLSFGCMLFNDTSKAYKSFRQLPVENIFFETDDTGFTIQQVYQEAAELREVDLASLERQMHLNFLACFGIDLNKPA